MLKLADNLKLPIDAATQTFAFIARKGAGKTYAAGKLTELLLDAGVQVVVLDTVGNWYGLRLGADGKSAGFDVPVLGGLRGDIPLEAAGGALIADIVVDTGRSLILDASQFSLADRKRFATTFGERLWLRKKGERHPAPLHLVIEESQLIVPQFTGSGGDAARMLGVFEEIIRLGRNYGIGVSMITQRPQSVNKEVLNQTECLFVGQVNGAQERDALKKWITHQGMDVHLVDELPGLKIGTFYVWSPQWLNILEKVRILPKRTFDASATPKVGDRRVQRDLKPLDLNDLQERLKATIEKAKADDPRELRKLIADLEKQLKAPAQAIPKTEPVRQVEVPVLKDGQLARLEKVVQSGEAQLQRLAAALDELRPALHKVVHREPPRTAAPVAAARRPTLLTGHDPRATVSQGQVDRIVRSARERVGLKFVAASSNGHLPPGEKATLIAASQYADGITREQASILTGYKRSSRDAYIQRLIGKGYVEVQSGNVVATDAGVEALGSDYEPLPTGEALQRYWLDRLPPGERAVLETLIPAYPQALEREAIDKVTGYKRSSRDAYIQRLKARQLVTLDRGGVRASDVLFEG